MRVVLCEPWLGGSHGAWAWGLAEHSCHDVEVVGLEDRAWRWRLRASAPWFAERFHGVTPPDLLIVSGLVDASVLRGLIGRTVPLVVYMHESQGAYPNQAGEWDLDSAARNWQSMLAADEVWFNSAYHLEIAVAQVDRLQSAMPREQRVATCDLIRAKGRVVYPGVDLSWAEPTSREHGPPVILWPHRWEHDKNPEVFERSLRRLRANNLEFRLVVAGSDSTPASEVRERLLRDYDGLILAAGPFNSAGYRHWMARSDIVVSCTDHEFFGIAVVEALAAGCRPVLPNGFSYPEVVEGQAELYEPGSFGSALEASVRSFDPTAEAVDVRRFDWRNRIGEYDELIAALVGRVGTKPID